MILGAGQLLNGSTLNCDVCIVGGGPAAITVALELIGTKKTVIMITGGEWNETPFNQDLNRGIIGKNTSHEPLEENRRRQFGGASSVWGGRCIPFDPIDFEKRDWIPNSGWPLTYKELMPYYEKATQLCLAGDFSFNGNDLFKSSPTEIIPQLDDNNILSWPLEKWSPPINFARQYKKKLQDAKNIKVLLNFNVKAINCVDKKQTVKSVTIASPSKEIEVLGGCFVLAAGAIENARLLLNSKSTYHLNGLGNDFDNVGRYYMSHINGTFAEVNPVDRGRLHFNFERDKGVYTRRRWWFSEKFQRKEKIGNIIMFLHHSGGLNGHRDALFSSVFLAKAMLSILKEKSPGAIFGRYNQLKPAINEHSKNVFDNGFHLIPQIVSLALKRFAKRRLPYILPSIKTPMLGLYFQAEHMPNRESRIALSTTDVDALGVPRAVANIAFSDIDVKTVIKAHNAFVTKYQAIQAGNVLYNEEKLESYMQNRLHNFNSAAHHLGTTRMAISPKEGVVDANCKVFDTDNLYIAGSSVFPTGGHANPTLTIVALSSRLGQHLNNNFFK